MSIILGLDIGGANTKFVVIQHQNDQLKLLLSDSEYFPFWKNYKAFPDFLRKLKKKIESKYDTISQVVFVTTAELADCFQTKKEGIQEICSFVNQVFASCSPLIFDVYGKFIPCIDAHTKWFEVAASNWVASAEYLGMKYPNAIMIDIGSTTTDIIPVFNGKVVATGRNDMERLASNELVFSGLLRTNVIAITRSVKLNQKDIPVSSEFFATLGDVYFVLDDISQDEFSVEAADGRPITKKNSLARLARIICADTNQLTERDIKQIAEQIREKHFEQLTCALITILDSYSERYKIKPTIILTGSGAKAIGLPLLRKNSIHDEINTNELVDEEILNNFNAYATVMLFLEEKKKQ
ncbi:MAG: hydantoinase/oxoprolinase family protein [Candidatus Heimdallarchaeota archaeon]